MMTSVEDIRILLVDDHEIVREGLRELISTRDGLTVVGEAGDRESALQQVQLLQPQLVLMDMHLNGECGADLTRRILAQFPSIRVIALSCDTQLDTVVKALRAGVRGYVSKGNDLEEMTRAIRVVMDHHLFLSPEISSEVIQAFVHGAADKTPETPSVNLSERERQLLKLIAEGKRNKEIASEMCVAVKSVETYRLRLTKKLGCNGTATLVRYAIREGIVCP